MKKVAALLLVLILMMSLGSQAVAGEEATDVPEDAGAESVEKVAEETSMDLEGEADEPQVYIFTTGSVTEESLSGLWYGSIYGITICLELKENGTYNLSYPELESEESTGTWILEDGEIYMDGEELPSLTVMPTSLRWNGPDTFLRQEGPDRYIPGEALANAAIEDYAGYWKSIYVQVDEALVYADALGDNTDIYIEGTRAALGGGLFGDVIEDFKFENGAFTLTKGTTEDYVLVTMQLLEDYVLRLNLQSPDNELILYLAPAYSEDIDQRKD